MDGYPRNLHIDLSKLRAQTLKRYAWYYNVDSRSGAAQTELASACGQHFMFRYDVDEGEVLSSFVDYCQNPNAAVRRPFNGVFPARSASKRHATSAGLGEPGPAKRKKQVSIAEGRLAVAHISDNWIMVRVVKHQKRKKVYKVEDADEMASDASTYEVQSEDVIALPSHDETAAQKPFPRGCRVLARFPKTSTFYDATVVRKNERNKRLVDYSLRFDDDEHDPSTGEVRIVKVSAQEVVNVTYTDAY